MGYRSPFVFSLILIAIDFILRIFIIEKHNALKYIRAGHHIQNFEAPDYVDPTKTVDSQTTCAALPGAAQKPADAAEASSARSDVDGATPESLKEPQHAGLAAKIPTHWIGLWHLLKSPRALTTIALMLLNGFVVGALQDTGMTLYLEEEYGLTAFGAGLVFLGFVLPTLVVRGLNPLHPSLHARSDLQTADPEPFCTTYRCRLWLDGYVPFGPVHPWQSEAVF